MTNRFAQANGRKERMAMVELTADDILARVPDALDTYGWIRREYETSRGVCLTAAAALTLGREHIHRITGSRDVDYVGVGRLAKRNREFARAMRALATVILKRRYQLAGITLYDPDDLNCPDFCVEIVVDFNDGQCRRRADIDRVCELARKQLAEES